MLKLFEKTAIEFYFSSREMDSSEDCLVITHAGDQKLFYKGNDCLFYWDGPNNDLTMVVDEPSLPFVEYALDYGYDQHVFPNHWRIDLYRGCLPCIQQWDSSQQIWHTIAYGDSGKIRISSVISLMPYHRVANEYAKINFIKNEYVTTYDLSSLTPQAALTFDDLSGVC